MSHERSLWSFMCATQRSPRASSASAATTRFRYVTLDELFSTSDVISLHVPLTPATRHLINPATLAQTKRGVVLINTSRGGLLDTRALIAAHQGFLTREALANIATTTLENIAAFARDAPLVNEVRARDVVLPVSALSAEQSSSTGSA